jgi:peptide/nickel transport system permease protein
MTNYLARRIFQSLILLFFVSLLIYVIINLVPGGPFDLLRTTNPRITQSQIDRLNALLDLDKPVLPGKYCPQDGSAEQQPCRLDQGRYIRWIGRVFRGDWGDSWTVKTGMAVTQLIQIRLGYTFLLMGLALTVSLIIAIPLGIYSAVKQYSFVDYLVTSMAFFGQSMPTFWTGLMAIAIFSVALDWFPTGGVRTSGMNGDIIEAIANLFTAGRAHPELQGQTWALIADGLRHVALPAMVLAFFNLAGWSRYTRSAMLEVMRQDYMRTARAKGLKERWVILKHGLRNTMIPLITLIALAIPALFGGALITETIFSWPGMGRLLIDAISNVDWPVVQGILVITAALVIFSNLAADVMYGLVDPRVQYH